MKIQGNNIEMIRGDTETIRLSLFNKEDAKVPLDEGDLVYFTVKESTNTESILLQKIITDFVDGTVIINIQPEDTKDLRFRDYVYDIQLNRVNGDVKTVIPPSKFTIGSEVTYE